MLDLLGKLGRLRARAGRLRARAHRLIHPLPRIVHVTELSHIAPGGCRFEIATEVEEFRVVRFGNERPFLERVLRMLRRDDVLFDIGACVGIVTLHAAGRGAQVVAFEPDPQYRARLLHNIRLNPTARIQVNDAAVSDRTGSAELFVDSARGWSASLSDPGGRVGVTVRTLAIDDALRRSELPVPTAIKMDIEGAEILALRGMTELLRSDRAPRFVALETHPRELARMGSSETEVLELLESAGYRRSYEDRRDEQAHYIYER